MSKFNSIIKAKVSEYNLVVEDLGANSGGAMGEGQMDAEMPAPENQQDAAPTPEQGAETQEPVYDKPYQDLAELLYNALRSNFDDLEQSHKRKILALHPDNIKDDKQGIALFRVWESVYNEKNGVDIGDQIEGDNVVYGPAAG